MPEWTPILLVTQKDPKVAEPAAGDLYSVGTLGVVVQAVALLPALRRAAPRLRPVWNLRHPVLRQVLRLSGWTFGYVISNQVAFWIWVLVVYMAALVLDVALILAGRPAPKT